MPLPSVGTLEITPECYCSVRNFDQFWDYAEKSLVPGMFGYDMFPGDDWYKYKNYIVDRQALRVCVPRLRQLRTKPVACNSRLDRLFGDVCRPSYSMFSQEEGNYKAGWIPVNKSDPNDKPDYGFGYSSAWKLKGSPTSGKFATYSGGGYVVNLGTQPKQALRTLKTIKAGNWLDKNTRCIIIEFLLYNNNVRLYGVAFLLVEFLNSGGAFTKYKVTVMRLEKGMTPTNSVMFFFQFIFLGFLIYFAVRASKRLRKIGRRQYFNSFWDVYEFAVILMGFVAIFMQIVRFFGAYAMAEMMVDRTKFINLDYVVLYDELSVYLLAMIVFLSTLQGLKLLRFNKRICALALMMKWLSWPLMRFMVVFLVLFFGFVSLCHLKFMVRLREYSTFIASMETLLNMMLNKFNFRRMQAVSPVMAPLMFVAFVIIVNFMMVNFMVAIILEGYTYAMDCIAGQANEYEIVDFMMQSFKKAIGMTRIEGNPTECRLEYLEGAQDSADEKCRELSNRVDLIIDRLENYIKKQADSKDVMAELEEMKKSSEKSKKRNIIIS
ncbi:polycystin-2-like [Tubulanus polymorphus]|uniref:polycystin-2-like n=1 Tax=Tubulanus polymorphus TaxID=672921 RepID=UPI003DA65718